MARDVSRVFRAESRERLTKMAEIICSHEQYFVDAVSTPTKVGSHFKHVRFMNVVERVITNLPVALYGTGLGSLISFNLAKQLALVYLGIGLIICALLVFPISIAVTVRADRIRRSIPPILRQEDVEVAITDKDDSNSTEG